MVADMITNEGQWNWGYLQRWLPTEILDSIATVPPPATHYGADTPGWRWSDKREFSVGSAYSVLMGVEAQDRNPKWRECIGKGPTAYFRMRGDSVVPDHA
ncbi:hypothetical protein V6N13_090546 [Hibiscus sabdariffa]